MPGEAAAKAHRLNYETHHLDRTVVTVRSPRVAFDFYRPPLIPSFTENRFVPDRCFLSLNVSLLLLPSAVRCAPGGLLLRNRRQEMPWHVWFNHLQKSGKCIRILFAIYCSVCARARACKYVYISTYSDRFSSFRREAFSFLRIVVFQFLFLSLSSFFTMRKEHNLSRSI